MSQHNLTIDYIIEKTIQYGSVMGSMLACSGVTSSQVNNISNILYTVKKEYDLQLFEMWFLYQINRILRDRYRRDTIAKKLNEFINFAQNTKNQNRLNKFIISLIIKYFSISLKYTYYIVSNSPRRYNVCRDIRRLENMNVSEILQNILDDRR